MTDWTEVATSSFGDPYRGRAKVCVVATRYGGVYERGRFAAIAVDQLESAAFGEDLAAAEWWDEHKSEVGVGNTPDAALLDWHDKQKARR